MRQQGGVSRRQISVRRLDVLWDRRLVGAVLVVQSLDRSHNHLKSNTKHEKISKPWRNLAGFSRETRNPPRLRWGEKWKPIYLWVRGNRSGRLWRIIRLLGCHVRERETEGELKERERRNCRWDGEGDSKRGFKEGVSEDRIEWKEKGWVFGEKSDGWGLYVWVTI